MNVVNVIILLCPILNVIFILKKTIKLLVTNFKKYTFATAIQRNGDK